MPKSQPKPKKKPHGAETAHSARTPPPPQQQELVVRLGSPLAIRLDPKMLPALERAAAQLHAERPGARIDRSETIRALLAEALSARHIRD